MLRKITRTYTLSAEETTEAIVGWLKSRDIQYPKDMSGVRYDIGPQGMILAWDEEITGPV